MKQLSKNMIWNMFLTIVTKAEDFIQDKTKNLEITTFGLNEIKKLLTDISNDEKNNRFLEEYKNKQLKCSICNKNISENLSEFGGIIKDSKGKWILICRNLNCYNKSLSK